MMGQRYSPQIVVCATLAAVGCLALALLLGVPLVSAQKLSLRHYDVPDGLAQGTVQAIHQDAKGYLWFGTLEGLSRFDGYRFTNYDTRDGLGHVIVNAIAEDRQGHLWVGTNGGGVSRLLDDQEKRFPFGKAHRNPRPGRSSSVFWSATRRDRTASTRCSSMPITASGA